MYIFLDESGDLGFDLSKTGTSKFFTMCMLVCDDVHIMRKVQKAVEKTLKNKINRKRNKPIHEIKSTSITHEIKEYFLKNMPENGWSIYAVTITKENVKPDLRTRHGKKKLYNWITKELLSHIKKHKANSEQISIIVDKCKNKTERGDFDNYIHAHLLNFFSLMTKTMIDHKESSSSYGLQAVDIFCGGIHRSFEHQDNKWKDCFKDKIKSNRPYFKEI